MTHYSAYRHKIFTTPRHASTMYLTWMCIATAVTHRNISFQPYDLLRIQHSAYRHKTFTTLRHASTMYRTWMCMLATLFSLYRIVYGCSRRSSGSSSGSLQFTNTRTSWIGDFRGDNTVKYPRHRHVPTCPGEFAPLLTHYEFLVLKTTSSDMRKYNPPCPRSTRVKRARIIP